MYNVYKKETDGKRKVDDDESQPAAKKPKLSDRYPSLTLSDVSDEETIARIQLALDKELSNPKPNKQSILELMEQSYSHRRFFVTKKAKCVREILTKYPAFKRPDVVSAYYVYSGQNVQYPVLHTDYSGNGACDETPQKHSPL